MTHAKFQIEHGRVADRIPRLAAANPSWFAAHICHYTGQTYQLGDVEVSFPLMSVIKPFLLLYLLEQVGLDQVFQWVGTQPSNAPFNSVKQLVADGGYPCNPMVNSGAITLCDKLPGKTGHDRCQELCRWLNLQAGCQLKLDDIMLASVRSAGRESNQALVHHLASAHYVSEPDIALDTYEQICCLSGQVDDLAQLGIILAHPWEFVQARHRRAVNALMLTCGLYEASGDYAIQIGLPMKSGISGALLAVVPGQGAIACYSPAIDPIGNSVAGLSFVQAMTKDLSLSIFG